MAMTFLQAKQEVSRNVGGSALSAQLTIAGQAIQSAIRYMNTRHSWEFRLVTLSDIPVSSGTATYALTAPSTAIKDIYTARLKVNKRTLFFVRQREVDRVVRDQEQNEIPMGYTTVRSATGVSIKLLPTPSVGETLQVRVYETIDDTYADGDNLGVPDDYLPALLHRARYEFLIDRDAEDTRAERFLAESERLLVEAIRDDAGEPDEDIRLIPQNEWGFAMGPNPISDLVDLDSW